MMAAGSYDDSTKTLTMYSEDEAPVMGFIQKYDFIIHFERPGKHIYKVVFYDFPTPAGVQKEFKMLEIVYTRK